MNATILKENTIPKTLIALLKIKDNQRIALICGTKNQQLAILSDLKDFFGDQITFNKQNEEVNFKNNILTLTTTRTFQPMGELYDYILFLDFFHTLLGHTLYKLQQQFIQCLHRANYKTEIIIFNDNPFHNEITKNIL